MISIFKQIEHSENQMAGFRALRKAFLELTRALPRAALPANAELSVQCKEELGKLASVIEEAGEAKTIDEAGKVALNQFEAIYHSNRAALEERDTALKDVVASVAEAMSGFKGHGERHEGNLSRLADEFDSLSRVNDVAELRRRLRDQVDHLRQAAQEMRRENDSAVQRFATHITEYQQRLEMARKETGVDRLTGLGSRREAERVLRTVPKQKGAVTVLLFDIEGFTGINSKYGTLFGDKILRAFTHVLRGRYSEGATLFRWGADEFLVIAEGSQQGRAEQCRDLCQTFEKGGKYHTTLDDGSKALLAAPVASGVAQYAKGESPEELYRRARAALDEGRKSIPR